MFLVKLYQYNKVLFALFTGFILLFIYINVKQGAVITPVYQYGMFSEPFYLDEPRDALVFYTTGKKINLNKLSFPARDVMTVSLENYLVSDERNLSAGRSVEPFLKPFIRTSANASNTPPAVFNQWYAKMVSDITGIETGNLEVYRRKVVWLGSPVTTPFTEKIFPVAEQ